MRKRLDKRALRLEFKLQLACSSFNTCKAKLVFGVKPQSRVVTLTGAPATYTGNTFALQLTFSS
jgi:hypothetical protein